MSEISTTIAQKKGTKSFDNNTEKMRKCLTKFSCCCGAVQKWVDLVDLVKSF